MRATSEVVYQKNIAPGAYRMRLKAPELVAEMLPGQFVHLKVQAEAQSLDPLLRRPISLADFELEAGTFDLVYQVVGRGTTLLAQRQPGEKLDVLGPLGRGFPLPTDLYQTVALVAGGVGVPPLYPLAKELLRKRCRVVLFYGARSGAQLLMLEDFKALGVECRPYTDDGSVGHHGRVTEGLLEELWALEAELLYACGPTPMLKALHPLITRARVQGWLSLENHMACGVGACLGCTVKVKDGQGYRYALLCQEGPVFDAREVSFDV